MNGSGGNRSKGSFEQMIFNLRNAVWANWRWLIAILLLIILMIILFIAFWIYFGQWQGVGDSSCSDCKTCTRDLRLPDNTCIHRQERAGESCASEDVCYNSTAFPKCSSCGKCEAPIEFCNGYCPNDDSSFCPELPFSSRLGPDITVDVECIGLSCVYIIVGGITSDCSSWLDGGSDNPLETQGCLYERFTDMAFNFPPGICFYRFTCAPFDFSIIFKKKKRELLQAIAPENFTDVANALLFLTTNNLKFPDLPVTGNAIITVANKMASMIDKNTILYYNNTHSSSSSRNVQKQDLKEKIQSQMNRIHRSSNPEYNKLHESQQQQHNAKSEHSKYDVVTSKNENLESEIKHSAHVSSSHDKTNNHHTKTPHPTTSKPSNSVHKN